ncbi:M48 family metalloprotease [Embleya sp. NPDC055664]
MATFRAVVAVGLLMGVYVLVLGLAVGDAVLVFEVLLTETTDAADTSSPFGALITVPVVGALFWGLAAVSRPTFTDVGSVPLTPEQAPLLWHTTRQLADAVGTSAPTEIHRVAEVNAGVTEEAWLLGLVGGRRRLYLGLPLVLGLTHDELRAVIAHELGHYAGRHTRLLAITHRSRESLHEIVRRLELTARVASYTVLFVWVVRKFFVGYAKCFDLLTLAMGRRQEFDADAVAARVAVSAEAGSPASAGDPDTTPIDGRGVVVDALRTQAALTYSWNRLIAAYVAPGHEQGIAPERPFDLFADMLDYVAYRATVDRLRMSPPEPPRTRRDTHPPLARRIAALGAPSGHGRPRATGRRLAGRLGHPRPRPSLRGRDRTALGDRAVVAQRRVAAADHGTARRRRRRSVAGRRGPVLRRAEPRDRNDSGSARPRPRGPNGRRPGRRGDSRPGAAGTGPSRTDRTPGGPGQRGSRRRPPGPLGAVVDAA